MMFLQKLRAKHYVHFDVLVLYLLIDLLFVFVAEQLIMNWRKTGKTFVFLIFSINNKQMVRCISTISEVGHKPYTIYCSFQEAKGQILAWLL